MDKPLISVIVPIYNVEKYLSKCIDSIIAQTYSNLEIILVDDGSPDNSGEICDKYAEHNDKIKVLHQNNQGVSAARNNGVKISSGKYISFVDPDDFIPENSIAQLYTALEKNNTALAVGGSVCVYKDENILETGSNNEECETTCYDTEEALRRMCYGKGFGVTPWAKLYQRELVVQNPYPTGMIYEDLAVTYKIIHQCAKVAEVKKIVYFYVQRRDSIMHCDIKLKDFEDGLRAAKEELEFMEAHHSSVVPAAKFRCCRKIVDYIPRILNRTEQNVEYFKWLQKELKPFLFVLLKDGNVSTLFKVRCIAISLGYTPAKMVWRIIDQIKGKALE